MEQDPAAAKAEELEASLPDKTGKKRKARTTDAERFKGIPVQKKYLDLAAGEKVCPVCNTALEEIGEEFVRRELVFIPAKLKVYEYYSKNYTCPECSKRDLPVIKKGKDGKQQEPTFLKYWERDGESWKPKDENRNLYAQMLNSKISIRAVVPYEQFLREGYKLW